MGPPRASCERTTMHFYLLVNPSAGRKKARAFLEDLSQTLIRSGHRMTSYCGEAPGDLARHVAGLREGDLDVLLLAGGDGTLRTVLNASAAPPPWPLGVLPLGTANLVAREAGTWPARRPEVLAAALLDARPWSVDLLEIRRDRGPVERAITTVSAGLDGAIVHTVAGIRGRGRASGGYGRWVGPILEILHRFVFEPIEVTVDGARPIECMTVVVQNTRTYGGFFTLSPEARLDSGCAQVVTLHARTPRDLVRLAIEASVHTVHRDRQVRIVAGRRVRLRAATPLLVQADGDPAGSTDLEVFVRPAAIRLLRIHRP